MNTLNPNYISGFFQGDGSFFIHISKTRLQIQPTCSLTQDLSSIIVLEKIKEYFGCGFITIKKKLTLQNDG